MEVVHASPRIAVWVGSETVRHNRRFVPLDTASKGEEFSHVRCAHVFEPALKYLAAVGANEMQEAMGQFSCLCEDLIHLRDPIQLLLCLRTQRLGAGEYPPDDLAGGHLVEG